MQLNLETLPRLASRVGSQVAQLAARRYRDHGPTDALRAVAGTASLWAHPGELARMWHDPTLRHCLLDDPLADPLVYASHRSFLVAGLTTQQRLQAVRTHYAQEGRQFDRRYLDTVYRQQGLTLWEAAPDGHRVSLTLCSPPEHRHEGLLAIVLRCDQQVLHRLSFAWVDAALFGEPALWGAMMLVTCNQSFAAGSEQRRHFDAAFAHNSPAYFCLAAAQGIAHVLGHNYMAGVKHADQIAHDPRHDASFRRSYSEFWLQFGALELPRHAYKLAVPVALKPLSELKSRHRARARDRRQRWRAIWDASQEVLAPYLLRQGAQRAAAESAVQPGWSPWLATPAPGLRRGGGLHAAWQPS